uniref:Kazal-like domain-containing protein n=1 Tax=Salvator merianae TaxID=96440 RepID=A0A8D0C0G0_SALMN
MEIILVGTICFFAVVCFLTLVMSLSTSQDSRPHGTRESYPLCDTDGKSYGNQCAFCREVVKSNGRFAVQHTGKCR